MNENPCSNNEPPSDIEEDGLFHDCTKTMPDEKCKKSNGRSAIFSLRVWLRCGVVPIVIAHTLLVLLVEDNFATTKFLMLIITGNKGVVCHTMWPCHLH
jgi:hypothetical protein